MGSDTGFGTILPEHARRVRGRRSNYVTPNNKLTADAIISSMGPIETSAQKQYNRAKRDDVPAEARLLGYGEPDTSEPTGDLYSDISSGRLDNQLKDHETTTSNAQSFQQPGVEKLSSSTDAHFTPTSTTELLEKQRKKQEKENNKLTNKIKAGFNNLKDDATGAIHNLENKVGTEFSHLENKVSSEVENLYGKLSAIPGDIWNQICRWFKEHETLFIGLGVVGFLAALTFVYVAKPNNVSLSLL